MICGIPPTNPAWVSPICRSLHRAIENRTRPGGGFGTVNEYGRPAARPKSDVPTAFPVSVTTEVG